MFQKTGRLPSAIGKQYRFVALLVITTAFGLLAACTHPTRTGQSDGTTVESSRVSPPKTLRSETESVDLVDAISQVAEKTIPAVVHIEIVERQEFPNPFCRFRNDPFFRFFYGVSKGVPEKIVRERRALGTGMIIDAQGHILTNFHVIHNATGIRVILSEASRYPATVVAIPGPIWA